MNTNVLRRYKMAEKVTDRLEGLNKDLTDVIDEINSVSGMLSNTSGQDDPVSRLRFFFFLGGFSTLIMSYSYPTLCAFSIPISLNCKRSIWMPLCFSERFKTHKSSTEPWAVVIGAWDQIPQRTLCEV